MTSTSTTHSPMRRCGVLTASATALWVVLAGPAYWLSGKLGLEGLTYSALLCWLPGCLLFFAIPFFEFAKNKAYAFLVGSGLRMFVVQGPNQGSHTGAASRYAYDFAPGPFVSRTNACFSPRGRG